tara:strand:- start:117 stop:356 length:240 start_codon:yes stop_codon:yes gene_type:complete
MQILEFIKYVRTKPVIEQIDEILAFTEIIKLESYTDRKSLPELINYIDGLRYKIAYNKATDNVLHDSKLESIWYDLKRL